MWVRSEEEDEGGTMGDLVAGEGGRVCVVVHNVTILGVIDDAESSRCDDVCWGGCVLNRSQQWVCLIVVVRPFQNTKKLRSLETVR